MTILTLMAYIAGYWICVARLFTHLCDEDGDQLDAELTILNAFLALAMSAFWGPERVRQRGPHDPAGRQPVRRTLPS